MKSLSDRLANALTAYAVANTPLYIIRTLREDDFVREIAREKADHEIFHILRKVAIAGAADRTNAAYALVLLAALALKGSFTLLKQAASLTQEGNRWYRQVASVLSNQSSKIQRTEIDAFPKELRLAPKPRTSKISNLGHIEVLQS